VRRLHYLIDMYKGVLILLLFSYSVGCYTIQLRYTKSLFFSDPVLVPAEVRQEHGGVPEAAPRGRIPPHPPASSLQVPAGFSLLILTLSTYLNTKLPTLLQARG
jgi:hypothetical protein